MRNSIRNIVSTAVMLSLISVPYAINAAEHRATTKVRAEKSAMERMETCKKQLGCNELKKSSDAYEACVITCVKQEKAAIK
jgi:hypothetical protein